MTRLQRLTLTVAALVLLGSYGALYHLIPLIGPDMPGWQRGLAGLASVTFCGSLAVVWERWDWLTREKA